MDKGYSVRLIDRNEVVEYRDDDCSNSFDLGKKRRGWTLYLPGSRDVDSEKERQIVERITAYLSKIWWFGIFPCRYTVRVELKRLAQKRALFSLPAVTVPRILVVDRDYGIA